MTEINLDDHPKLKEQVANLRFTVEAVKREGYVEQASQLQLMLLWERARYLIELLDGKRCEP